MLFLFQKSSLCMLWREWNFTQVQFNWEFNKMPACMYTYTWQNVACCIASTCILISCLSFISDLTLIKYRVSHVLSIYIHTYLIHVLIHAMTLEIDKLTSLSSYPYPACDSYPKITTIHAQCESNVYWNPSIHEEYCRFYRVLSTQTWAINIDPDLYNSEIDTKFSGAEISVMR